MQFNGKMQSNNNKICSQGREYYSGGRQGRQSNVLNLVKQMLSVHVR